MVGGFSEELSAKKISTSILNCLPDKGRGDKQRRAYEIDDKEDKPAKDQQLRDIITDAFGTQYLFLYYEYMDMFKRPPVCFEDLFEMDKFMKVKRGISALRALREED